MKKGMSMNSFVESALWDAYVKYGKVTDAYALIYIEQVSWTAMVVGYITQLEAMRCSILMLILLVK